ncbi:MAG: hypothetical protein R3B48_08960 [Kofleriaceae bacterium]
MTLLVDADVIARPLVPNASKSQDFTTELRVRLEKGGAPITSGTVTLESSSGKVDLTFNNTDGNRWIGAQAGYSEVYRLTVLSGEDFVDDVRVDGPALHWITAPMQGETVDTTMPVVVKWSRGESAEVARIDTDQLDQLVIDDTGTYTVPAGGFKSKRDGVEQERIRIDRSQRVTPSGALVGSEMRVTIHNEISVVVAPVP